MTEEKRETLLKRIKKLLALAGNNPNEAEAAAATEKVHALLAEHNLSMTDVKTTTEEDKDEVAIQGSTYTSTHPWRRPLARTIAEMNFCRYLYIQHRFPKEQTEHIFIGTPININVATMMFDYLTKAVERFANEGAKKEPAETRSTYRVVFRRACALRLCTRIQERMNATKQRSTQSIVEGKNLPALMSLYERYEAAANAYVKQTYPGAVSKNVKSRTTHYRASYEGALAGDKIGLDQQVGKSNKGLLK